MREFKFRVWDVKRKSMDTFDLFDISSDMYGSVSVWCISLHKPNIIMEFTGIKDSNGKEIYEYDIVHNINPKYKPNYYVNVGDLKMIYALLYDDQLQFDFENDWEIVGNIYENPELLKEVRD